MINQTVGNEEMHISGSRCLKRDRRDG
ncbi:hypothetical protein RSAG8_12925, partial [Rhizoctonia solani AG-8 WAC10335]